MKFLHRVLKSMLALYALSVSVLIFYLTIFQPF